MNGEIAMGERMNRVPVSSDPVAYNTVLMTDPMRLAMHPRVTDRFLWEPLPDGCLLYEQSTGELLTLNDPAELILSHCDGEHSVQELCRRMKSEFELVPSTTLNLIDQLFTAGVISCSNESVELLNSCTS